MVVSLGDAHIDGVEQSVVYLQRVNVSFAVKARCGRGIKVEQQALEVDVLGAVEEGDHRILTQAFHMELHGGQQAPDG